MTADELKTLLTQAFPDATVIVEGDDGVHFAAEVIHPSFAGMNRVQQHRAVNAALKEHLHGSNADIHALALTTRAP